MKDNKNNNSLPKHYEKDKTNSITRNVINYFFIENKTMEIPKVNEEFISLNIFEKIIEALRYNIHSFFYFVSPSGALIRLIKLFLLIFIPLMFFVPLLIVLFTSIEILVASIFRIALMILGTLVIIIIIFGIFKNFFRR